MSDENILLQPHTLWDRVKNQTEYALECGALLSIPTEFELVEQDGVKFLVRILSNLARKDAAKKQQDKQTSASGKEFNPFLPYEQDLFVADISNTHVCILNKFNVVDYHLLIITRAFEEQESLLTLADFAAMWGCLAGIDGLVFYNAGKTAGASQKHKHLQLLPLPLTPSGTSIPIEPLLAEAKSEDGIFTIPRLPYQHAFAKLNPAWIESPYTGAKATLEIYHHLLQSLGLNATDSNNNPGAYNLLATREWMLIVPRSQEKFQTISINSLGFAGAMLVKNPAEMQLLKQQTPINILTQVAKPKPPRSSASTSIHDGNKQL